MTDAKTEAAMRAWYVGLPCRKCGQLVKQNDGGFMCRPRGYFTLGGQYVVIREPWAECRTCRETSLTRRVWKRSRERKAKA